MFYIDVNIQTGYNKSYNGRGIEISGTSNWRGKSIPASKAQQKAVTKYVKAKYGRFGLTMPKCHLDEIKAHVQTQGGIRERLHQPGDRPRDEYELHIYNWQATYLGGLSIYLG